MAISMNRLVAALLHHPEVVATATAQQEVTFEWLADALGEDLLSREERARIATDWTLSHELEGSYLRAIAAQRWNESVQLARSRPSVHSPEWVTMVPAVGAQAGLTAPEDGSDKEKISLFIGPPPSVRRISVEPEGSNLSISVSSHCSLPIDSKCDPGFCGGCKVLYVEAPHEGQICRCDD
jgi:hypothetical protein